MKFRVIRYGFDSSPPDAPASISTLSFVITVVQPSQELAKVRNINGIPKFVFSLFQKAGDKVVGASNWCCVEGRAGPNFYRNDARTLYIRGLDLFGVTPSAFEYHMGTVTGANETIKLLGIFSPRPPFNEFELPEVEAPTPAPRTPPANYQGPAMDPWLLRQYREMNDWIGQ